MDQIIDALIDLPNLESKSEPINIKSSLSEKINQDSGIALIDYIIKTIKE
jgi:hypothetical protein